MKLEEIHSVYFIGIGGIGMSALARWFMQRGANVAGYDRVETELCKTLVAEGIDIHYEDNMDLVPKWALDKTCLIVYTPAVPETHVELTYFRNKKFELKKRSEVLGIISKGHFTVAVAGTHGKTTTSSMVAHLLNGSSTGCSAFIGGIMTNYSSNLIIGDEEAPVVAEADEFDRSFLRLHPNLSVVTSLDPDHLDIYKDEKNMFKTYVEFMNLTDARGEVLLENEVAEKVDDILNRPYQTYGLDDGEFYSTNLRSEEGYSVFDYYGTSVIEGIRLLLPGSHNVKNATAAITVAAKMGMSDTMIKSQMESYTGVKRRFEYVIKSDDLIYIDDYAHHPSEISSLLHAVRELYPGKKITTIFQPHLYSRTKDFQNGFAESLSISDELLLLDIYPARELPIKGITSERIFEKVDLKTKSLHQLKDFPKVLQALDPEVLLTVGAGDIDTLVPKIKKYYQDEA